MFQRIRGEDDRRGLGQRYWWLSPGDSGRGYEKRLNSEHILKTEPTGIVDRLDVRSKGKKSRPTGRFCLDFLRGRTAAAGKGESGVGRISEWGEADSSWFGQVQFEMSESHPHGNGVQVQKSVEQSGLGVWGECERLELPDGPESRALDTHPFRKDFMSTWPAPCPGLGAHNQALDDIVPALKKYRTSACPALSPRPTIPLLCDLEQVTSLP